MYSEPFLFGQTLNYRTNKCRPNRVRCPICLINTPSLSNTIRVSARILFFPRPKICYDLITLQYKEGYTTYFGNSNDNVQNKRGTWADYIISYNTMHIQHSYSWQIYLYTCREFVWSKSYQLWYHARNRMALVYRSYIALQKKFTVIFVYSRGIFGLYYICGSLSHNWIDFFNTKFYLTGQT